MRILTFVLGMIVSLAACAQEGVERFQKGVHYNELPEAVRTITPGKIEVTEAFAYTCGHCFNFEPRLKAWEKKLPEDVALVKLPVVWRPSMQILARIMYTGEALGMSEKVNEAVFNAIHVQRKQINNEEDIAAIFTELGVEREKFDSTFNSFGVSSKVQQASARTRSMNVTGTPQLIVDGRYTISATKQIDHAAMLEIANFLVDKIRLEK